MRTVGTCCSWSLLATSPDPSRKLCSNDIACRGLPSIGPSHRMPLFGAGYINCFAPRWNESIPNSKNRHWQALAERVGVSERVSQEDEGNPSEGCLVVVL